MFNNHNWINQLQGHRLVHLMHIWHLSDHTWRQNTGNEHICVGLSCSLKRAAILLDKSPYLAINTLAKHKVVNLTLGLLKLSLMQPLTTGFCSEPQRQGKTEEQSNPTATAAQLLEKHQPFLLFRLLLIIVYVLLVWFRRPEKFPPSLLKDSCVRSACSDCVLLFYASARCRGLSWIRATPVCAKPALVSPWQDYHIKCEGSLLRWHSGGADPFKSS